MTILRRALALLAVALLGAGAADPATALRGGAADRASALHAAAKTYYADAKAIALVTGRDTAMDYYLRLLEDADMYALARPADYTPDVWAHYLDGVAALDLSLAGQLERGSYVPLASIRGLGETLVRSSRDGTMQPVAVYVPSTYVPGKPSPLIVFLHGRMQSESSLIAPQFLDDLAEKSGTIVIAPYGRGYYDFSGAEQDVYDALDAAESAFSISPRQRYLAGYSMGGYSVYAVAPLHPNRWSAVMSIAGALQSSRSYTVTAQMPTTPFYILTGALDDNIPTRYPTTTAVFFRDHGVPVTFYSDPVGTHRLYSLRNIIAQAWTDMEHGVIRTPASLKGAGLLSPIPPPSIQRTNGGPVGISP